jgi:hypothetical protein
MATAIDCGQRGGVVVAPSCKFHLPGLDEQWRIDEYAYTLDRLAEVWRRTHADARLVLEKDFSPTLAGSTLSRQQATIVRWLEEVADVIARCQDVVLGIKIFNTPFDDAFQLDLLRRVTAAERASYVVFANRLFDPEREFDGHRGVAYGGPDLSARNLRVLSHARDLARIEKFPAALPLSATGNIVSGRIALEYVMRGATSCQIHTGFQLPADQYTMRRGSRTARTLHRVVFDPDDGFIAGALALGRRQPELRRTDGVIGVAELSRAGLLADGGST